MKSVILKISFMLSIFNNKTGHAIKVFAQGIISISDCHEHSSPVFSQDRRYLFFCPFKNQDVEVYWVDTKIINQFIPENYK